MPLLCVSSPKGGVGKTTITANVAWELARMDRRVIVLDLDPQNAVGLHFGMDLRDGAGFMAFLRSVPDPVRAWRSALRTGPAGLSYLPHGQLSIEGANALALAVAANPDMLLAPLRDMLSEAGTTVIADMPPGPTSTLTALLPLATLLLVVLRVDAPSLAQLPAIESGRAYGLRDSALSPERIGFALNQLDLRTRLGRASGETAARHLGQRLLGVIYRDENVSEAIAAQKLVGDYAPNSKAAQDMAALAEVIARHLPVDEVLPAQETTT